MNAPGTAHARPLAQRSSSEWNTRFADYCARLALSSAGRSNGVGVGVKPSEGALHQLLEAGVIHESLVEEPRAA